MTYDPNTLLESTSETETHALASILADAAADAVVEVSDDVHTVVTPPGAARHLIDLQRLSGSPSRAQGTLTAHDAASFAAVVDQLATEDTRLYINTPAQRLTAVLNDDGPGHAGWRDRRVELVLQPTPEWVFWTKHQGMGEQQRFAEVIEDGLDEIVSPAAADMLELAQSFEASIKADFRQAGVLATGARQLAYAETAVGAALGGVTDPFVVHGAAPDPAVPIPPNVVTVRT